jgi:hypothetical protein
MIPALSPRHFLVRLVLFFTLAPVFMLVKDAPGQAALDNVAESAPAFTWSQESTSIGLMNHGRIVWQHVHDKKIGKPFMRIGLLDGTELTRPCPFPKDYPKADHTWHRALWWSWKSIDGVNYWEQNQTGTEPVKAEVKLNDDGSTRIELAIAYHLPDDAPVVTEKRIITVGAPDAAGSYLINWQATFVSARDKKEVVFNKNSYGGFALRMAAECCGNAEADRPPWTFLDSEGRANCNGQTARWVVYQGTAANGRPAAVAMFDHPNNPRHPSLWQSRAHYPYLNPSFTCKEDYTLPAGETLTLRYGVLVHDGSIDAEGVEQRWKAFADE